MRSESENGGGSSATIALVLLLLLLLGGAGVYLIVARQQMALAAERARAAEAMAILQAEQVQQAAEAKLLERASAGDAATSPEQEVSVRHEVESVLRAQEEAWNQGDLDAFVEHYWNSDDLTFSSNGKTTRGWAETLARYRERYPNTETMGQLTLSGLEITPLGDSAALVLGEWRLKRESEPLSGNFSLVFRNIDDRWLIIHDHTSRTTD